MVKAPRREQPDTLLVAVTALLVALGLVMVFSASSATAYALYHDGTYFLKRQALWLTVALFAAFLAYRVDYRRLQAFAPAAIGLTLVMLVLVLVPHVGYVSGGARRWLGAGPLSFQPSEVAKLGIVLYLASALARKGERIGSFTQGVFPMCAIAGLVSVLILIEPDMGTASLIAFTCAVMLFSAGARIEHLVMVTLAMAPPVGFLVMSSPYRRARILAFLDPWKDAQNAGFHIVQSLLALGSGGIPGVGLGLSRQKFFYLPEQYTDFIGAVLGEELGFIGTSFLVALFILFAYRAIRIAIGARDDFGFFLAVGATSTIVVQAFINVGVVTSSWPVTGVPLPFISFGGTSLIVSLVCVGLLLNIGRGRARNARFD
jgi:cell division protein FtsW